MSEVRRFFIGILTFFAILIILTFAVTLLTIVNIPRIIPNKNLKVSLGSISNTMGSATVASITSALRILHKLEWDFQIPEDVDTDTCDDCANGTFDPSNDGIDFDSDGFTLKGGDNSNYNSGGTGVGWSWKANGGSGASTAAPIAA